jgi:glycosyltransferase involved in cell wall biosynthesis/ubiquinone/menaquinone biosynthesis C-methylase UbiE
MPEDIEIMKKQLKANIALMIENGSFEEAYRLLKEYMNMVNNDEEAFSMLGIIAIHEGRINDAEKIFQQGLLINKTHFDLNFNLAYLHEIKNEFVKALQIYLQLSDGEYSEEQKDIAQNSFQRIKSTYPETSINMNKKKIVFFVKQGLDGFLGDIIDNLSINYETKKVIVTDLKQIDQEMLSADICWFEWCDELVGYGSNLPLAREKILFCRIHRYEVFTDYPQKVKWENVDTLMLVTDHLRQLLLQQIPNLSKRVNIVIVENGINLSKYKFIKRKSGFNIAYVGFIHSRKNPVLLLQIINELVKINKKYKLYIAGKFQEPLIELYWNYQIQCLGLQDHVIFQGWQDNMSEWLQNKNYLLSTSIHESFGYGIAEAMAQGIKPVIHNFVFSEEIWDKKYLFNTVSEAVDMIINQNYDSQEYRSFIEERYSLEKQINEINVELERNRIKKSNKEDNIISLEYLKQNNDLFIPYTFQYVDDYNFRDGYKILIGKKERITSSLELIEFLIENMQNYKLLCFNIFHDTIENRIGFPNYLLKSKNLTYVKQAVKQMIGAPVDYINNIGSIVFDESIKADIQKNQLIYNWERGIPATGFAPAMGYLRIIERYKLAGSQIKSGNRVLEAASGFGYGAAYMSKLAKEVHALDIAPDNIKFAESAYRFRNIKWKQGDVTKLPYADEFFDVYVSFETMEHLPLDIVDQYFKEAVRVLRKGGKMILSTPNGAMRKHIKNPFHIKEYTFTEFNGFLNQHFSKVEYYSALNHIITAGFNEMTTNMLAVCEK